MILRARWVLPIEQAPLEGGWIEVADGRVVRLGRGTPPAPAADLGDVAILPGLVNAHTHLELSWMAGRVPPSASMADWIRTLLRTRREGPPGGEDAAEAAMRAAATAMARTGTVLAGDVSNALVSPRALVAAGIDGVVFHELLGFHSPDAPRLVAEAWERVERVARDWPGGGLRFSVVAHAPYSVAPDLFREIARRTRRAPLSVHLGESPEEVEFLRAGLGPMRRLLEDLGVWTDQWRAPGTDPVEYLAALGYVRAGTLVVHGVYLEDDALARMRRAGAVFVTCPRSNAWVGAGAPRLARVYASGVPVAVGTDSLASSASLNLFDELAEMRRVAPEVPAAALLDSATRQGARALGFGAEFGAIAPGRRAALVAVDVPGPARDVEEYLVSGVPAAAVRRAA
jgi:cytosine/adenosine deaminase-related metal-dependent hydrolase